MGEARLPPWYVNVTVWLLYEVDLPPSVRVTGMRILGLGWNHDYEYTDRVPLAQLCAWCGLSRARIYGHLRQLRFAGVLRYTALAEVFVFDLRPARAHGGPARAGPSLNNETQHALSVVVVDSPLSEESLDSIEEKKEQQQHISYLKGGSGGGGVSLNNETRRGAGESGKPDRLRLEALERMGVLEPVRSEIAGLEWASVGYLTRWLLWLEEQDGVGVGLVIQQMRMGMDVPAVMDRQERERERRRQRYQEQGLQT